jgi:soluble lytic murein transglycosylase
MECSGRASVKAAGVWRDIPVAGRFGKNRLLRGVVVALALTGMQLSQLQAAAALPTAPSPKPRETHRSKLIPDAEFQRLCDALGAADDGRWGDVRAALARLSDPAAKMLLQWRMATDAGSTMGFAELVKTISDLKGWPDLDKAQAMAELVVQNSGLPPDKRVEWLRSVGPKTGDGLSALADALAYSAQPKEGLDVARAAWRTRDLSEETARHIRQTYANDLTTDDNWARADMLLFRGNLKAAQAMAPTIDAGRQKLLEARIALEENRKKIDSYINAVPTEYAEDPGLLLGRAKWMERKGDEDGAVAMLLRIKGTATAEFGREDLFSEKQSVIRRMIRQKDYATAYQLSSDHGLKTGDSFRDAEWQAGWLSLKLSEPVRAEKHFRTFLEGVTAPISVARGNYWLGEALTKQGRGIDAQVAYVAAAKYLFVFYGQLAAEKIEAVNPDSRTLSFPDAPQVTEAMRAAFVQKSVVRAAVLLGESGRQASFERFSYFVDDHLESAAEHQMLYDIGLSFMEPRAALRGAKAGLARGLIAPDAVFPVLSLPSSMRTGSAEPAMVLALTRQESEFNPLAVSGANARGLMQIVPAYAKDEARKVGLPYKPSWLTDDPSYNLKLGRGFLDDLVDRFGGSYLLAVAAYNAGPSRAVQWIRDYGDPRVDEDPVDFIESIPFSETRNYVQRIMENTQVYRQRLAGQPTQVKLRADLKRGRPTNMPINLPDPESDPDPSTTEAAASPAPVSTPVPNP